MSRSGSRPVAGRVAGLFAGLAGATFLMGPAAAEGDRAMPVVALVAPVVDLDFATADLQGAARIDERSRRVKVTLASEVLFGKDSALLRPVATGRLKEVAATLGDRGPGPVTIVGYTDDLGSAAHGLALSRQRARAVARALRPLLGRDEHPFVVSGKGEAEPAVPNVSEANRRLNRRVELTSGTGP